ASVQGMQLDGRRKECASLSLAVAARTFCTKTAAAAAARAASRLLWCNLMGSKRILVVDDEQNARDALRTILMEEGFEVSEAADGQEALALLPEFAPDLVLADVRMPRMDGLTLL